MHDGDELLLIRTSGKVIRSSVDEVEARGRTTMGVQFAEKSATDLVISIARNVERDVEEEVAEAAPTAAADASVAEAPTAAAEAEGAIVDATDPADADRTDDVTEETDE